MSLSSSFPNLLHTLYTTFKGSYLRSRLQRRPGLAFAKLMAGLSGVRWWVPTDETRVPRTGECEEERRWLMLLHAAERRIQGYVRRAVHSEEDVAELLADVRWRAWLHRDAVLVVADPAALLIGFAREACREWIGVRRREVPLRTVMELVPADVDRRLDDTSMSVEEVEGLRRWEEGVLNRLSAKQRLAVDYHYRRSWAHKSIAQAIDSTESAVRVHAYRGLHKLRSIASAHPPPPIASLNDDSANGC